METNLFKVSLGVSFDLENILLKDKLRIFTDKFPNVNIKINRDSLELLWKGLLQYSYDFFHTIASTNFDTPKKHLRIIPSDGAFLCLALLTPPASGNPPLSH